MRSKMVLISYHHHNTEKVARVFAEVLGAQINTPGNTDPMELQQYELIGFGSGIYSGKHHQDLLDLADRLPAVIDKKAFLFSTSFDTRVSLIHSSLREILESKGYLIIDEFNCKGYNTNSFLKLFGGLNRGRPNAEDLERAKEFALGLQEKMPS